MSLRKSQIIAVAVSATMLLAGQTIAQQDFDRVVSGMGDASKLATIIEYMDQVVTGQEPAPEEDQLQAGFWRAEARYRQFVERAECSGQEPLYADDGVSVYSLLEEAKRLLYGDKDMQGAAIEKQAWCIWRTSECVDAGESRALLKSLLTFVENDGQGVADGSSSKTHLQQMRAMAAYRLLILASRFKESPAGIRDLEYASKAFHGGPPMTAALHRAAALAAAARAYYVAGMIDSAGTKLNEASRAGEALLADFPGLRVEAPGADLVRQSVQMNGLMSLALGRDGGVKTLKTVIDASSGPSGIDRLARLWAFSFSFNYADSYLEENGVSRASIWASSPSAALGGLAHGAAFWAGWAKYLESYNQKSGDFKGAEEFQGFVAGRPIADPMTVEAYYRLADIEYRNGRLQKAIDNLERVVNVDSPRREDIQLKLDVCRLEAAVGTTGEQERRIGEVLYRLKQNAQLSDHDRVRRILELGRHFIARAAEEKDPDRARRLYGLCGDLLGTLDPSYSNAFLQNFLTGDGQSVGNVLIRLKSGDKQLREAKLLQVISMIRAAPYRGISTAQQITQSISEHLRFLAGTGSERDYINGLALYTAGMFQPETDKKRECFEGAIRIFNQLLSAESHVGVRALYYMGRTFGDMGQVFQDDACISFAQQCYARIKRLDGIKPTDRWYRLATEAPGAVQPMEATAFQYKTASGEVLAIDIAQAREYAPPDPEQITFEVAEGSRQYELDGVLREFADVWVRYAGTVPQIPLSTHKVKKETGDIFPVTAVDDGIFGGLVDEYWGLMSRITFNLGVLGDEWGQRTGPVVRVYGEAQLEGRSSAIDEQVPLKLDSATGTWRGSLTLEPPIGSRMDSLLFSLVGFYIFRYDGSSRVRAPIEYVFTRAVESYSSQGVIDDSPYRFVRVPGHGLVCRRESADRIEDVLKRTNSLHYRDFTPLGAGGAGLVGVQSAPAQVVSVDAGGQIGPYLSPDQEVGGMAWPEGIASDIAGNLYIADWGNHRVVIYDKARKLWTAIGKEGINEKPNAGIPVRFEFPTRIAVEEPPAGSGKPRYLMVADLNGVHRVDEAGFYIDSPVRAGSDGWDQGEFYGLACDGYGEASKLYLADRKNGRLIQYSPR